MAERDERLTYYIDLLGIEKSLDVLKTASKDLDDANTKVETLHRNLSIARSGIRDVMEIRSAIEQMGKAIKTADPWAFVSFISSSLGVLRSTIFILEMLQKTSAAAGAATAILDVLTGNWWLIPLALAAAGVVYAAASRSMQAGGVVKEAGWYYLHEQERVLSRAEATVYNTFEGTSSVYNYTVLNRAETAVHNYAYVGPTFIGHQGAVNYYGPFNMTVSRETTDLDEVFREWSWKVASEIKRA